MHRSTLLTMRFFGEERIVLYRRQLCRRRNALSKTKCLLERAECGSNIKRKPCCRNLNVLPHQKIRARPLLSTALQGEIMKKSHTVSAATAIAFATLLGACSSPMPPMASRPYPATTPAPVYSSGYGVVESIQTANPAENAGLISPGTVLGGVAGGVLGNQVGGGSGRTAATVAGTVGGAILGQQIEQNRAAQSPAYQIGVRLNDGTYRTVTQETVAGLNVGDRVRIEDGRAYRY
jgi:outer membrane lipoprotein SlyB